MLMSVAKRNDEDERTLGELFYFMVDEVADITFNHSMKILMDAMIESLKSNLPEKQRNKSQDSQTTS